MSEPGKDKSANSGLSRPAQPQATWPMTPGMQHHNMYIVAATK